MATEKIRGLILAESASGENSKHIVVLAKEKGKVRLFAKGARKPKSKLMAGTQLFCYCEFLVYEGRGFQTISQVEILESFYHLRTDLDILTQAAKLLRLVDLTCVIGENYDASLKLLLRTFWRMAKKGYPPRQAAIIFCWKHLQYAGLMPATEHCAICAGEITLGQHFDIKAGGFVCNRHAVGSALVSPGFWAALCYIFVNEDKAVFLFGASDKVINELEEICAQYLRHHLHVTL